MNLSVFDIILILLLLPLVFAYLQRWYLLAARAALNRKMEKARNSKLLHLIHVQPASGPLSFFMPNYIDIKDAQKIVGDIRTTPKDKPIDIILHTPGGLVVASQQIAQALAAHPAKVTAFVPFLAMSGGTMVALAADEIVMGENALLGRLDPQIVGVSAVSIVNAVTKKDINKVDDKTLVLADAAEKAIDQVKEIVVQLLKKRLYTDDQIKHIIEELILGKYTHDYPISFEEAKNLGLRVSLGLPEEAYDLLELYPQR